MCCFVMFVTAVCVLFLLKLKWPKNKSFEALFKHSKTQVTNKIAVHTYLSWSGDRPLLRGGDLKRRTKKDWSKYYWPKTDFGIKQQSSQKITIVKKWLINFQASDVKTGSVSGFYRKFSDASRCIHHINCEYCNRLIQPLK